MGIDGCHEQRRQTYTPGLATYICGSGTPYRWCRPAVHEWVSMDFQCDHPIFSPLEPLTMNADSSSEQGS